MRGWLGAAGPSRNCGPAAPVTRGRPASFEGAVMRDLFGASGAENLCALDAIGGFCAAPQLNR
jgi:hypothetical protein